MNKMGLNEFYAPDGALANATDGSGSTVGTPETSAKTPAWMAQLPNDLKTNESLTKYATVGDAIKGLMESQSKPTESVKPEVIEYKDFNKALSTNDDPFGEIGNSLKDYFQKKGRSQADAEEFFDSFTEILSNAKGNMIAKGKEMCEQAAKAQWGKEYDTNRALMAKGYQAIGDTDGSLQKALDETGASLNPALWEILCRVGRMVSEDSGTPNKGTGGANTRPVGVPIDYSKPSN